MNQIDFGVMGLNQMTNEFLNWCMKHRDNLEFLKELKTMELRSASAMMHFSNAGKIEVVEENKKNKR